VLDCVQDASARTRAGMAVVVAANRTRHPLDARTLARLAAQYAGRGGRGLRPVERRAARTDRGVRRGLRIADRAGLLLTPHGGELRGPRPRAYLPRQPRRAAARARGAQRGGPGAARPHRAGGGGPRGVPRCRTSRWASTPTSRRCRSPSSSTPARRSRSGRTTRCSSGPAWPASTPRCGQPTTWTTRPWPGWPRCRSPPHVPRRTWWPTGSATSRPGWRPSRALEPGLRASSPRSPAR
jgi:hypothetical protein